MTAAQDPFQSVRLKPKSAEPQEVTQQPIQQEDPFSKVRINKVEGSPVIYEGGRHAARLASRVAETIGGIPGDISDLIQSGVFAGLEKLTGVPTHKEAREMAKKDRLPTSGELKEFSQKATKGFTSPQNPIEEAIDSYAETAASLLGPMKFRKALGVALGASLAKEGLKTAKAPEAIQEAGKLGSMFLLSMWNPGGAMNYAKSQYGKAAQLAGEDTVKATELHNGLNKLVNQLQKGVTTSEKTPVINPAKELINKIDDSTKSIRIDELMAAKRDVNAIIGDPSTLKGAKKQLKNLSGQIDSAIARYEYFNPEFKKAYRPANEIYGVIQQGNKVSDFTNKVLGTQSMLATVIGEAALGHPEFIVPSAIGLLGARGAAKTTDLFLRMKKSKELRKYYTRALLAATKEDAAALRRYSDKIDSYMNNDQSSSSSSLGSIK